MKKFSFLVSLFLIVYASTAQNVLIFQPDAGKNDGTDEGGLHGGKDSFVYDEQYLTNYGTSVVFASNPISTCNLTNLLGYIKFDVSNLPADVDSVFVIFMMYQYVNYCYSNCDNNFDLRYVTTPWDEVQLNWNNKPASGEPFSDTVRITFPYLGGPLKLDITQAYKAWKSGTVVNEGFTIYPLDGWCNNACVSFCPYSSDHTDDTTYRPYLEIYYGSSNGMKEESGIFSALSLYPNPACDVLNVYFNSEKPTGYTVSVFDCNGRLISEFYNTTSGKYTQTRIDVNDYASGLYLLQLKSNAGEAKSKFMVLHQ